VGGDLAGGVGAHRVIVTVTVTVGKGFRTGRWYISGMARERGVVPPEERRKLLAADRKAATAAEELRAAVVAAHAAGGSVREIATLLGKSPTTIQSWVKAAVAVE